MESSTLEWAEPSDAELAALEEEIEEMEIEMEMDPFGVLSILDRQEKYEEAPMAFTEIFSISGMRLA